MPVPFNKPFLTGNEIEYIRQAVESGKISGNGQFTQKCQQFFEQNYGFRKTLLTTSCTSALEMAALLLNIQPCDEVIVPSFAYVSTANAFALRGAHIVFADSLATEPNINVSEIEQLITSKTKAIVPVHYAGVACNMEPLMRLAKKYNLWVVEDAAHAIDSYYYNQPLGGLGHLAAFSFHETKNIMAGEGGMLVINDEQFNQRAEIIWEKGTNRTKFFKGEIDKYGWVDLGSSFQPSEITAAFLYAQLQNISKIQSHRKLIWQTYYSGLQCLEENKQACLPEVPAYASCNAHIFYILTDTAKERTALINYLNERGVNAVFHYQSLHRSEFYSGKHNHANLPNSDFYTDNLLRLPLYYELSITQVNHIIDVIKTFYQ